MNKQIDFEKADETETHLLFWWSNTEYFNLQKGRRIVELQQLNWFIY